MSAHDNVASKYPMETMLKAASTPIFRSPNTLRDWGRATVGARGARAARRGLVSVLRSIWNGVTKVATFANYICEQCCENHAIFARFMHEDFQLSLSDTRDF